ncbi:hypothetical protein [Sulfurimonas paralvinellae]|uniref:Uncharacterized protein n=1 Tax=Sulfurimonas paralvinellae TaxID=317658 RepID=A0A7M1B582_9BACT|nr:hypothetical protein [Sulfurimonas paralvinellae]QOP44897.1 hypothetical protein FM071_00725 [Sulfurimonas paralvinellae]
MDIAKECRKILREAGVNSQSHIDFDVNGEVMTLTLEYIIDAYMQASKESQLVFYAALQKSLDTKEMGIEKFFEGMGQLLLMSHLSEKFEGL